MADKHFIFQTTNKDLFVSVAGHLDGGNTKVSFKTIEGETMLYSLVRVLNDKGKAYFSTDSFPVGRYLNAEYEAAIENGAGRIIKDLISSTNAGLPDIQDTYFLHKTLELDTLSFISQDYNTLIDALDKKYSQFFFVTNSFRLADIISGEFKSGAIVKPDTKEPMVFAIKHNVNDACKVIAKDTLDAVVLKGEYYEFGKFRNSSWTSLVSRSYFDNIDYIDDLPEIKSIYRLAIDTKRDTLSIRRDNLENILLNQNFKSEAMNDYQKY